MKMILDAAKLWMRTRKVSLARRVFNILWKDPLSGMSSIVENAVNQRTVAGIINWLDFKGILHCMFCPDTEQLTRHPAGYICARHQEMANREWKRREEARAKAPEGKSAQEMKANIGIV